MRQELAPSRSVSAQARPKRVLADLPRCVSCGKRLGVRLRSQWASGPELQSDHLRANAPEVHPSNYLLRPQSTRLRPLRRPPRKSPSVLVAFVDEVLRPKACELVPFAQLQDSIDGRASRLALFACRLKRLARKDFLHVHFDRNPALTSFRSQFVRHFNRHFHLLIIRPRNAFPGYLVRLWASQLSAPVARS